MSYSGQEDCLILNVYVPEKPDSYDEDLPVMVYVHGGGFITGDSGMYGPKYLLERDVILVTVNYRLGPLGFLNLGKHDDSNISCINSITIRKTIHNTNTFNSILFLGHSRCNQSISGDLLDS